MNAYAPNDLGKPKVSGAGEDYPQARLTVPAMRHLGAENGDRLVIYPDGDSAIRVEIYEEPAGEGQGQRSLAWKELQEMDSEFDTNSEDSA